MTATATATATAGGPGEDDRETEAAWYQAYGSGDEAEPRHVRVEVQDDEEEIEGEEEDGEFEVEEMADDEPMHITERVYLGSIDAACNLPALRRAQIGFVLSLLGKGEEEAVMSSCSYSQPLGQDDDEEMTRVAFQIEDSAEGDLLCRLPEILATLEELISKASLSGKNVLVHCIAGRSRSPSVLAAWMSNYMSVQDAIDHIRVIRPWIEINPHFMRDLHLFHATLGASFETPLDSEVASVLETRSLPRLDFGAGLVDGILQGSKTITMRLLSDVEDDTNSDLGRIFPLSLVVATSATRGSDTEHEEGARRRFAFLRIERCETQELRELGPSTVQKSGFKSIDDVLTVLQQFYPHVTMATPLLMLHFVCVGGN